MPRITYSVPSVTTRLGTRAMVTIAPLTIPQAMPMPSPARNDDQDRDVRMALEEQAGRVGGEAEHRADREVDVARDDHHRLADREQAR